MSLAFILDWRVVKRLYLVIALSYPDSCFSKHYGRYLLYKKAHLRSLNPMETVLTLIVAYIYVLDEILKDDRRLKIK